VALSKAAASCPSPGKSRPGSPEHDLPLSGTDPGEYKHPLTPFGSWQPSWL
jgi:hypothetical protein